MRAYWRGRRAGLRGTNTGCRTIRHGMNDTAGWSNGGKRRKAAVLCDNLQNYFKERQVPYNTTIPYMQLASVGNKALVRGW